MIIRIEFSIRNLSMNKSLMKRKLHL